MSWLALRGAAVVVSALVLWTQPQAAAFGEPAPTAAEVEVRASPGPAIWTVTHDSAEVVILGTISPTPPDFVWNTRRVAEALRGARTLLLSPGSTPGLAWADHFSEDNAVLLHQPFGRTLSKEVGQETAGEVERVTAQIDQRSARYASYRPGIAGMILLQDAWRARRLTGAGVDAAAMALARSTRTSVVKVDEGGALPRVNDMPSMTRAEHAACLREALDQWAWQEAHVPAAARAWADGDLHALHDVYRPVRLCLDSIPGGVNRRRWAQTVWAKALDHALAGKGRTVALMDVSELLEPSPLLAYLRGQGHVVIEPRSEAASDTRVVAATAVETPASVLEREPVVDLVRAPLIPALTEPAAAAAKPVCVVESRINSNIAVTVCRSEAEWKAVRDARERRVEDLRGRP